eukprot:7064584-Alexandrium_andersonii.AAC.1
MRCNFHRTRCPQKMRLYDLPVVPRILLSTPVPPGCAAIPPGPPHSSPRGIWGCSSPPAKSG